MRTIHRFNFVAVALMMFIFGGCSSNPHKAEKIDVQLEKESGDVAGEKVGVNQDGNMVIQRKVLMSEELRRLQNEVYELEDRVYGNAKYGSKGLYGVLKDCRKDLSDKKNGGTGKLMWTEPLERVTDKEEPLKIGVDNKDVIIGVSEEFLKDRLARFKGYKQVLLKREDEYQDKVDICRAEVRSRQQTAAPTAATGSATPAPTPAVTPASTSQESAQ